jgi:hypothetical protein
MDSLKKDLRTGNKAQHEAILILHSKIIQFSFGIIEKIQEVVHNEELILKKANYELYLENSCCQEKCDDNNEYAVSYFEKKSEDILKYNGYVKDLTDRIDNIAQYTKASILSSNINTKIESIPLSKGFEENTIVLTFIKCCHYKTLQPVPTIFNMVCPEKPVFDLKNNNTKEMIKKIKENPQFTELYINNFPQLLQIANRQNIYHPQSKTKCLLGPCKAPRGPTTTVFALLVLTLVPGLGLPFVGAGLLVTVHSDCYPLRLLGVLGAAARKPK